MSADRYEHRVPSPGVWETTKTQVIAGIRRYTTSQISTGATQENFTLNTSVRRRRKLLQEQESMSEGADEWEAYIINTNGEMHSAPLPMSLESDTRLYASEPGPSCRVGFSSVGIAMGNAVYTITAGSENGTGETDLKRTASSASASVPTRRKPRKSQ